MRNRITITISQDLLEKVDERINNYTIRNRSQAIEALLRQIVKPSIHTAVILAGGPVLEHQATHQKIPKPLLHIKGKPLIDHTLEHLKKHSIEKVIICTGSESDKQIRDHCGHGNKYGVSIKYSTEQKRLGTGGALKQVAPLIGGQPFLLIHGDVITNINITEFTNFYVKSQKLASVAVKPRPGKLAYGRVFLEGSEVIQFQQPTDTSPISLVNTGIYIFDPKIFSLLPSQPSFKLESSLIPQLIKDNQISGYVFQGIWFDISDTEDYTEANGRWQV